MGEVMVPMTSNKKKLLLLLVRIQNTLVMMDLLKHSRHPRCFIYMDRQRSEVHISLTAQWIVILPLLVHQRSARLLLISRLRHLQVPSWDQCGL